MFFTAFDLITQCFNSISQLMWKCEGQKSVGKVEIDKS